ncbi:type VI secretion system tip protein VgrG [Pseudomonas aeruginosa]|nr:type VI secretion system tip protein VgrG [Pseudomonas aeruginosa]
MRAAEQARSATRPATCSASSRKPSVVSSNPGQASSNTRLQSGRRPSRRQAARHRLFGSDLAHEPRRPYERYDYPGRYKRDEAGKPFTENRLRGHRRDARIALVEGDDPRLLPGLSFDLDGHPRDEWNSGWRPVRMRHHGVQHTSQAEDGADSVQGTRYGYTAELVTDRTEWRAEPLPKPRIDGTQPATVVGPPNEEIYCDKWGRVKIQFPWDRLGNFDDHSSCWVRAVQNWAGAAWGHMAIPRIGQEVLVVFMNGDPDQPIIVGRTFMATQPPPYELPRHKTRMTIKSQTHKGQGFNELRFEDEAGQEEVFIHAQKDQNNVVNNDETTQVGHDRSERVENDETVSIGHNRKEDVGNDETISIGRHRKEDVGKNETISIGRNRRVTIGGHKTETITKTKAESIGLAKFLTIGAAYQTSVGAAMNTTVGLSQSEQVGINKSVIVGKTYSTTAGEEFSLTVGKSSLILKADGTVLINGVKFDFSSSEHTQISSKVVDIN